MPFSTISDGAPAKITAPPTSFWQRLKEKVATLDVPSEQSPEREHLAASGRWNEATAMRLQLTVMLYALVGWGPACADCVGPPYDQFDFWLGEWHDPAAPAAEHYAVRRTAGGCAIEEVLTGGNGQIQDIGVSGWDSERKQWRQLWADKDRIVTVYILLVAGFSGVRSRLKPAELADYSVITLTGPE